MNERQRIEKIIQEEHITAREFATQVGISAGTLSNILSGRNNPSLDVMKAILNVYRHISSDWLILDAGTMYRSSGKEETASSLRFPSEGATNESLQWATETQERDNKEQITGNRKPGTDNMEQITGNRQPGTGNGIKKVQKILIFYTDGTFEER